MTKEIIMYSGYGYDVLVSFLDDGSMEYTNLEPEDYKSICPITGCKSRYPESFWRHEL